MTSVVDTSVKFIHEAMPGAPVLSGQAGSLISLLDAFLVTGFGLVTATSLVVSGGVATLGFSGTSPAEKDGVIVVAGSSMSALNGEQKVIGRTSNTVQFATAAADGTAGGTITFKMAPLGWSKTYTDTNKAVYRSNDVQGSRFYLRVDDTNAQYARVRGYESMSDIDTGTGPFPTESQVSGGLWWGKSFAANSNPVGYTMWGDSRVFFHAFSAYMGNSVGLYDNYRGAGVRGFGDVTATRAGGDPYSCTISGNVDSSWSSYPHYGSFNDATGNGLFFARSHAGLGTSQSAQSRTYIGESSQVSGSDSTLGTFPNLIDGSMRLSRRYLRKLDVPVASDYAPRCDVPGFYHVPQSQLYSGIGGHRVKVPASGELAGRTIMSVCVSQGYSTDTNGGGLGAVMVDITGPWLH